MTKDRMILAKVLKAWAQDHDINFNIADPLPTDEGLDITSEHFSWLIKNTDATIDLLTLLDRLEFYINNRFKLNQSDGLFCKKCKVFFNYAEPNQSDGTLICWSCRHSP